MHIEFTVHDRYGPDHDVAITAPPGTVLGAVHEQLGELLGLDVGELWAGARRLVPATPLGAPGLRTGEIVTVGRQGERDLSAGAVLRAQVVGGPDAGQIVALPRGIATIGRCADCDVVLTDPDVSRRHAAITVTSGGITVRDLESSNGTTVDGAPIDPDGTTLNPGAMLRVGDSFVLVSGPGDAPAAVHHTSGGAILVNRPPRVRDRLPGAEVVLPTRGGERPPQRVQWIAAALPALTGVGLALVMHSPQFLVFAVMSPVIVLATATGDRLHWRRTRRRDARSFRRREASARAEIVVELAREVTLRRRGEPDPAAVRTIATAPGARLWERRRDDDDALTIRLGVTDLPSALRARRGPDVSPAGQVDAVPVGVDLRTGPLGIGAPAAIGLGVARWLVCQLAVLHSPSDIEIALVLSDDAAPSWEWARWLPHVRGRVATTPDQRQALVVDLNCLVEQRCAPRRSGAKQWCGKWVVVVVDRASELTAHPGLAGLLAEGPASGVTAICLADQERRLPVSCTTCAVAAGETGSRLRIGGHERVGSLEAVADRVTLRWADGVARALAPLAAAGSDVEELPAHCRLLDLLGIEEFDITQLLSRWDTSNATASTILGTGPDGPFEIDLVRDGPHTLVAGTTGAGKSELLQTLVAGLAASHPPEAVSFVLIDYKGGAAFADCARLPHTLGVVTDLDAQLTARALRSLHAELSLREELFAQVGAKDLAAYSAVAPTGAPLGRLVLVVDEFAALAEELPDFVSGLIAIAQRGRSLGVHLVLATQRPGGVVSPEIRANTTLRIALRVSDPAESSDIVGTDRAAYLGRDTPGRAIVRIGATVTELQTARVGGVARPGTGREVVVTTLGTWRRSRDLDTCAADGKTDLQLLADALREAAVASGREPRRRQWLPPLPARLSVRDLPRPARATSVGFGLLDQPDLQRQPLIELDLSAGGSVLFTGGPRSGRSTALVTIATVAAGQLTPDELAIYLLDCGGGALRPIADLPHCGTATTRDRFEIVQTLLLRLEAEITSRQVWLSERGLSGVAEARARGHAVPMMLCLLDGWEGFVAASEEHDDGRCIEMLVRLLRAAPAAGLSVVLAGDRSTLAARLASAVSTKFVLRLAEVSDYALAGIPAKAVPRDVPPGRAVRAADGAEVQVAFLGSEPSRAEQSRCADSVGAGHSRRVGEPLGPFRVIKLAPLPGRITLAELPSPPGAFTLGVGGDAAAALPVDVFAGAARLLVAGPPRSGRTSVLRTLLAQAGRNGAHVVVAAPRRSPLVGAAEAAGIAMIAPDASDAPGAADAAAELTGRRRCLLLVDDSEAFLDTAVGELLSAALRSAPPGLAAVVVANSDDLPLTFRGIAAEVRRSRCALVLHPGPGDGDLLGQRLPRRRGTTTVGRGLLVGDGAWGAEYSGPPIPIQVALP